MPAFLPLCQIPCIVFPWYLRPPMEKVEARSKSIDFFLKKLNLLPSDARLKHRVVSQGWRLSFLQYPLPTPSSPEETVPSWVQRKPDLQPSRVWLRIPANGQGLYCRAQFESHVQTWKNHQYSAVVYPKASTEASSQKASLRLNKLTVIGSSCIFRLIC